MFTFAITNRAFILFFRGECCTNFYRKDGKCIGGLRIFFTILPKRVLIVIRLYLYILYFLSRHAHRITEKYCLFIWNVLIWPQLVRPAPMGTTAPSPAQIFTMEKTVVWNVSVHLMNGVILPKGALVSPRVST